METLYCKAKEPELQKRFEAMDSKQFSYTRKDMNEPVVIKNWWSVPEESLENREAVVALAYDVLLQGTQCAYSKTILSPHGWYTKLTMEILTTLSGQILVGMFSTINIVAFFVMGNDKRKATHGRNAERAPEGFMFFLATIFGSLGVYLGMLAFRHKTRRWYFQIGIPLLIFQNIATVYMVWSIFF